MYLFLKIFQNFANFSVMSMQYLRLKIRNTSSFEQILTNITTKLCPSHIRLSTFASNLFFTSNQYITNLRMSALSYLYTIMIAVARIGRTYLYFGVGRSRAHYR
jgi:hypothetical protein